MESAWLWLIWKTHTYSSQAYHRIDQPCVQYDKAQICKQGGDHRHRWFQECYCILPEGNTRNPRRIIQIQEDQWVVWKVAKDLHQKTNVQPSGHNSPRLPSLQLSLIRLRKVPCLHSRHGDQKASFYDVCKQSSPRFYKLKYLLLL